MTVRPIHVWPHKALRAVAERVEDVHDVEVAQTVKDLRDTVKAYRAQGVAATQLGVTKRIIIVKDAELQIHRILINPEYINKGETKIKAFEGCLSFPGVRARIERAESVDIAYVDEDGHAHQWTPSGLEAIAIQHEMDHLDGKVMIDYMSSLEKRIALRRLNKVKKRMGTHAQ